MRNLANGLLLGFAGNHCCFCRCRHRTGNIQPGNDRCCASGCLRADHRAFGGPGDTHEASTRPSNTRAASCSREVLGMTFGMLFRSSLCVCVCVCLSRVRWHVSWYGLLSAEIHSLLMTSPRHARVPQAVKRRDGPRTLGAGGCCGAAFYQPSSDARLLAQTKATVLCRVPLALGNFLCRAGLILQSEMRRQLARY